MQTGPLLTGAGVSPGEKPPVRSDESKPHTANGALEFGAYFYQALNWSIATTNSYLLKQVSADTCDGCNQYIKTIDDLAAAGGDSSGGRVSVASIGFTQTDNPIKSDYTIEATLTQENQVVRPTRGAPRVTYTNTAAPIVTFLLVSWGPTGWQVVGTAHP